MSTDVKAEPQNGYLGEIMIYTPTGEVGVVEGVVESQSGWTIEMSLRCKDSTVKRGGPLDFVEPSVEQRREFLA